MKKLTKPSKSARIVQLKTGDWYILWYSGGERYRAKLGLNRIKSENLRSLWANRIVDFINGNLKNGQVISEIDIPDALIPSEHEAEPAFVSEKITVLSYFSSFIKMKETENMSKGWILKLKNVRRSLQEYANSVSKKDFNFEDLGRDWAVAYKAWRYAPPRSHSQNYVDKDFRVIRQVLTDAEIESDIEVNKKYKSKAFKVGTVLTDEIALTITELKLIADLDLGKRKGYALVRDNFVVGCLTALRFSDWGFGSECIVDIEGRKMIRIASTEKTKTGVLIPIHPIADKILRVYNYEMPNYSNQKTNSYLKDIACWAGLTKEVSLKRSKGGKTIVEKKKQYEAVKTHTARRTFVTVALFELKLLPQHVMKITGHKTEKQLFEYARIGNEVSALVVAQAMDEFFKI